MEYQAAEGQTASEALGSLASAAEASVELVAGSAA